MPEPQGLERYQRTESGLPVIGLDAWARGVEGKEPARAQRGAEGSALVRHEVEILTRAIDTAAKTITIVAGTSSVDRYRDRIMVAGYDDAQFRRNPIMPWCHEYWSLPVAQGVNPRIEGDAYVLEASFADTSRIYPFASMVWEMYAAKVLRMASVGGMPATWVMDEARRGMDVLSFDLWEVSLCPLGVNPDAMAKAKLNGIDARPLDEWARAVADAGGSLVLSKPRAEALVKALGYGSGMALFELDPDAILALRAAEPAAKAEPEPEPLEEAEKPKPRLKDEHPDEDEMPMEEPPEEEKAAGSGDDGDLITLDLEEAEEAAPVTEAAAGEDEVEIDEEELRDAVQAAVQAALREAMQSTPAGQAR